jgi:hypothetical protein
MKFLNEANSLISILEIFISGYKTIKIQITVIQQVELQKTIVKKIPTPLIATTSFFDFLSKLKKIK